MPIDSWEKLVALPNADYRYLVELLPGKDLECGSDWTSVGSNTYRHDLIEKKISVVLDDSTELTERADLATLQAAAEGYYFDFYAQQLYVKAIDLDDLSSSSTTVVIMPIVYIFCATDNCEFGGFQYKAIVMQDSLPNMDLSVDDVVEGIYKFNFGSFRLMNADAWFDTAADDYVWLNRRVLIRIGGENLPYSEYPLYFVGRISDMYVSDEEAVFSVKDIRVGTFSQLPIDHYWLDNYKFLNPDDESKPIPIFYGEKENIIPICTQPFDDTLFRAVADDGGSMTTETTEALSIDEDDMTLLPLSPAVDDAYYFGQTTAKFGKIHLLLGQEGVGDYEIVWEYWNGSAWVDLSTKHELSDGSDGFTAEADEWHVIEFNRPGNWATTSVNSITAYWVRARVSEFTSMSQQPLGTMIKLDDTTKSVWKIAGHEINDILKVKKNSVGSSAFSKSLSVGEYTFTGYFDTESDTMECNAQGKVVDSVYLLKGASIAKDILKSYLGFIDSELDLPSFTNTDTIRTHPLCIYLNKDTSSREVLQTIGRSIIAFFSPTEDGKLSFEAYEPTVPEGTLELHDPDYDDNWRVQKDDSFVRNKVILQFDQNPRDDTWKTVERDNPTVLHKYGVRETLTLKTYVKNRADGVTICEGVRDMCSKPITVVDTSFGMKGFTLFPTRKVVINRERAADSSGAFVGKVFRIRRVSKDTSTEKTHIIAMDDLQTLGESFCYVCFSCQICVAAEASCTDCYTCQLCYATQAGCQVCDACELCVTDQGGCQVCNECESCDSCQSTVGTCPVCEICVSCEECNTCESTVNTCTTCQFCYGCQLCDTCEAYVSCASCDSCQVCYTSCENCNTAQDCTSCDVCDTCESYDVCGSCDASCQDCDTCEKCVTTYNRCGACQVCYYCEEQDSCASCDTCQLCNASCENCNTQQECSSCDTCVSCEFCDACDSGCYDCQECFSCQQAIG